MEKKKTGEWMYVRNLNHQEWIKRIVIDVCSNGCVAVVDDYEEKYNKGEVYNTVRWDQYKPIPERKTRPMTVEEVVKLGWLRASNGVNYSISAYDTRDGESTQICMFPHWFSIAELISVGWTKIDGSPLTVEIDE